MQGAGGEGGGGGGCTDPRHDLELRPAGMKKLSLRICVGSYQSVRIWGREMQGCVSYNGVLVMEHARGRVRGRGAE